MHHLDDNNLIPDEIYVGRQISSTSKPIEIPCMLFDITRKQKNIIIRINVDAEA